MAAAPMQDVELDGADGDLAATRIVLGVELYLLAFAQALDAGALKRGGVDEHVLLAVVRLDEAEAFLVVVEFDGAVSHRGSLSFAYARGMWRTDIVAIVPFRRFWREAETCARK